MNKEYSCGALVYRSDLKEIKYLVIHQRYTDHFGFPKGHMEENEKKEETAIREVYEETNIKIDLKKDIYYEVNYIVNGNIEKEVTYFLAKALTYDITYQEEELFDASWVSKEELLNLLTFENDINIFNKLSKHIKE